MNRRSELTLLCLGLLFVFGLGCADDTRESKAAATTNDSSAADESSDVTVPDTADIADESRTWNDTLLMVRTDFPGVRHVSTEDLAVWQADPTREAPLLLDTRAAEEYEVSHLRGAVLADSDSAIQEALKDRKLDQPVVLYCSVGYRSSDAAQKLQQAGYVHVYNLEGSIFAWANEGREVVSGTEGVVEVHPYDDDWGVLLERRYHPRP